MKSFFRFLQRNKLYSFIEFFGLIVSLAFIIIIFNYAVQENTVPKGQKDADKIYVLGLQDFIGLTYATAEHVCPNIPEIESYTRLAWSQRDLVVDGNYFKGMTMAADADYFDFFSYGLLEGDTATALQGTENALVSRSFANKAFGGDAIGKNVQIVWGGLCVNLTVVGVFEDFDNNIFQPTDVIYSMRHPIIFSKEAVEDPLDHWGSTDVFIKLTPDSDRKAVHDKLTEAFLTLWPSTSFVKSASIVRMDEVYFCDIPSNYRHGNKEMVDSLLLVALVLLISAVLNYMNLSIAQSGKRAREMATRRLLGSSKVGVFFKYCFESFYFCIISFAVAFLVALALQPSAEGLLGVQLSFSPSVLLVLIYVGLLLLIAMVSGAAQYFLVSKIKSVEVMKGEFALRSKNWFSKVFIVIQSSICIILLAMAFTMQKQMNYLMQRPRGYNTENLILVRTDSFRDWIPLVSLCSDSRFWKGSRSRRGRVPILPRRPLIWWGDLRWHARWNGCTVAAS